ncbi:MAG: ATP-dependent DNA helicase RecQ, partial [Armatimonadetes bacterium]|nr:ATP-dependent DNA helicase RecQ [Armatimonadota bacterium]
MTAATVETGSDELHRALREWFGFESFLPVQEAVVPALLLPPLTVVISPLIALMKDQVDALNRRHTGTATFINSSITVDEPRLRLRDAVEGRVKLLYVAPERFRFPGFLRRLAETRVQRFVVDEAHCISEWGHDFRPDYRFLKDLLGPLGDPPLLALTATATQETQRDIAVQLGRPAIEAVVSGFNRSNLSFEARHATGEAMKLEYLHSLLAEIPGSGIVYTATRKDTEAVAKFVEERTHRPVVAYHAGFETDHRTAGQDAFMAAPDAIAVATCAFGMGIDKPEVRFVIHYSVPGSLEAYYQQAGRAGRDGLPARCILLYCPADRALQEWFIEHEGCSGEIMAELLAALAGGLTSLPRLASRLGCHELQVRSGVRALDRL